MSATNDIPISTTTTPEAVQQEQPHDSTTEDDSSLNNSSYHSHHSYDSNLPPGRMHATRVPERLTGGNTRKPPQPASSVPRSRSRSPAQIHKGTINTATTFNDANSSISSLDDIVDQDILYDRQGFVELDLKESQSKLHNSREFINLPPVNERLSEETLEDAHAFNDLAYSSNASRASVGSKQDAFLEPLDECGEDSEEDDMLDGIDEEVNPLESTVILTNMENLKLNEEPRTTGGESTTPTA
jgi:hypothetical protein